MKKFFAVSLIMAASSAFAAESALYDVMYLPKAGTVYGFTTGTHTNAEVRGIGGDFEIDGFGLNQTAGFSVLDNFSIQASISYDNAITSPEDGSNTSTSGISDPSFQGRFRLMDSDFRLDVIGGGLLSLGDSEVDKDGDSNNLEGGSQVFVGAEFGKKVQDLQWSLTAKLNRYMESTTDIDGGSKVDDDAHNGLFVRGDILNVLPENNFIRTHLSADFTDGYEDEDKAETSPMTTYELGTEYQYLYTANLLLRAGVDYTRSNVNTGQIDNFDAWIWTLGANYQF